MNPSAVQPYQGKTVYVIDGQELALPNNWPQEKVNAAVGAFLDQRKAQAAPAPTQVAQAAPQPTLIQRGLGAVTDFVGSAISGQAKANFRQPMGFGASKSPFTPEEQAQVDAGIDKGSRQVASFVVPQDEMELGAAAAIPGGKYAVKALKGGRAAIKSGGVLGGAIGGETGGLMSGQDFGEGALVGGGGAALGEVGESLLGAIIRALPGMKTYLSNQVAKRVGGKLTDLGGGLTETKLGPIEKPQFFRQDVWDRLSDTQRRTLLADIGEPAIQSQVTTRRPIATQADILEGATGAKTRIADVAAQNEAQREAHRAASQQARQEATIATAAGKADRRAEWNRRVDEYKQAMATYNDEVKNLSSQGKLLQAEAQAEADAGTRSLRQNVETIRGNINTQRRGQAAEQVQDVITRVTPQLADAFGMPGEASLRAAAGGRARQTLVNARENMIQALEQAAPNGITVPSLLPPGAALDGEGGPIPVRQALQALSEAMASGRTQYGRNALDRTASGHAARVDVAGLRNEIAAGLDAVAPGAGDMFRQGQQAYAEGITVTKRLLERDANWGRRGELNTGAMTADVSKPRTQRVLEDKLGPDRYRDLSQTLLGLPQQIPPQATPRIQPREIPSQPMPERPALPRRPLQSASVRPDLPDKPVDLKPAEVDVVMDELFGKPKRIIGGEVNWPAVQKGIQDPASRAKLLEVLGRDRYLDLLKTVLNGADVGFDRPARGTGRALGPVRDVLAGRDPGGGAFATAGIRALLPNLGGEYVGARPPFSLTTGPQSLLDLLAVYGLGRSGVADNAKDRLRP